MRENIVSGAAAKKLYDVLPNDWKGATIEPISNRQIVLSGRRCSVGIDHELSGGVVVEARLKFNSMFPNWYWQRRLLPGWTREQFIRAASRCYAEAMEKDDLRKRAENLDVKVVPILANEGVRDAFVDEVDIVEEQSGHPTDYLGMTKEDFLFWEQWIAKWKQEHGL